MAKINIPFDNTNYSIEESAFASASAALKSHLSTVMNGSGATITIDGTSYNVDSTKLSTATNAFVSHLGTIAGSGKKVFVNGVEYSVASDKVQSAIADIHTALGNLQSGNDDNSNDPALNHTSIADGAYYANLDTGTFYDTMPATVSGNDAYLYGDYFYMYQSSYNGWVARVATESTGVLTYVPNYPVTDYHQTSYGSILESINGKPVVSMYNTFEGCVKMTIAPKIPSGVTSLESSFNYCEALTTVSIPVGVTSIEFGAFYGCTSLTNIEFEGTIAQWNAINKASNWNCDVLATEVVCSDGTVAL